MIFHFPPKKADVNDNTFLVVENTFFAKFKRENTTTTKTVFLTQDTLVFILRGNKHLHIDNETITVNSNEIIFLRKGIYAMAEYFEEGLNFEAILLFLNPQTVWEVISEYGLNISHAVSNARFLKLSTNKIIEIYKEQLKEYFTDNSLKDKGILLLKQKEILLYILKTMPLPQTMPFWSSVLSTSAENLTYTVEKYLFQKLSLEDLAGLTNRSISTFKREFNTIYGSPPKKWINLKRLEHARLLLNNTQETISQISDQCGFDNSSYFTRLFKNTYGLTPSEFRTNCST
ncbi:helix-turn-helix domain-containing protein [Chryseobacterium shigense]|uniref:AraC-like DNA-binding protein n=1 Tax=Chryseobacterium shigense TaxID=297244 RepID=A0A841N2Q6_9FLAO|nr:AraC family transcriptional regulator [Chryseobacterium shigense]MBB6369433.1 AraC-like DNA-binding protein [Chryseobacterium shigense]